MTTGLVRDVLRVDGHLTWFDPSRREYTGKIYDISDAEVLIRNVIVPIAEEFPLVSFDQLVELVAERLEEDLSTEEKIFYLKVDAAIFYWVTLLLTSEDEARANNPGWIKTLQVFEQVYETYGFSNFQEQEERKRNHLTAEFIEQTMRQIASLTVQKKEDSNHPTIVKDHEAEFWITRAVNNLHEQGIPEPTQEQVKEEINKIFE